MSAFETELSNRITFLYRNMSALEEKSLSELNINLTLSEIHLVNLLANFDTDITVSDVASHMGITRPSATVAVSKIVNKGYALKESTPDDARKLTVKLTRYGRKINELFNNHRDTAIQKALSEFREEEKHTLLNILNKFGYCLNKPS